MSGTPRGGSSAARSLYLGWDVVPTKPVASCTDTVVDHPTSTSRRLIRDLGNCDKINVYCRYPNRLPTLKYHIGIINNYYHRLLCGTGWLYYPNDAGRPVHGKVGGVRVVLRVQKTTRGLAEHT